MKNLRAIIVTIIVIIFISALIHTPVSTIEQTSSLSNDGDTTFNHLAKSSKALPTLRETHKPRRVVARSTQDAFQYFPANYIGALTGQVSHQLQGVSRELWNRTTSLCLWHCNGANLERNTTHLLLFTRPDTGDKADLVATKNILPETTARDGFNFDPTKPSVLIIHGFRGRDINHQSWAMDLKDLILSSKVGANVFFADWSHHARVLSYTHALNSVGSVAYDLWLIFSKFEATFPEFKMTKMNVVGHSLGAHVAGMLGQLMDGELEQITALDPAGVLLTPEEPENKLSQGDAKYVLALHTSNSLGTEMKLADRDVYLNGGETQPGCRGLAAATCSHRRAAKFGSTKMGNCIMVAYLCASYDKFERGECGFCERNSSACLVGLGLDWQYNNLKFGSLKPSNLNKRELARSDQWTTAGSKYYIETLPQSPYCAFTYQLVVKFLREPFSNTSNNTSPSFLLILRAPSSGEQLSVIVSNRLDPSKSLKVFAGIRGEEDNNNNNNNRRRRAGEHIVRGRYLFTSLALLDTSLIQAGAKRAPKFQEAYLAGRRGGEIGRQNEAVVYVNFMSHVSFEERAARSGPLKVKWLSNAKQFRGQEGGGASNNGDSSGSNVARIASAKGPRTASSAKLRRIVVQS